MSYEFRVGYRRNTDGSVVPVCEPPVDELLLKLWANAATAILETDHYIATGEVGGNIRFDGRLRPYGLVLMIGQFVQIGTEAMRTTVAVLEKSYPFAHIAKQVVYVAKPQLLLNLDQMFVAVDAPTTMTNGRNDVDLPRVECEKGGLRVTVTGHREDHPLRTWADSLISERMRDAILDQLLSDPSIASD